MENKSETSIEPSLETSTSAGLRSGDYCLIGWDMDTTGRRLFDEICQIAAYTPTSQFAQYIMPTGDLIPASRRQHNIRFATVGQQRVLKSNIDNTILNTKSECEALSDFLSWLEENGGDAVDGVILIFHDPRKIIIYMLLEALNRYDLLNRFKNTVTGFCNGYALIETHCPTLKSYGLQLVSRKLFDYKGTVHSAVDRARLVYQVSRRLSQVVQMDCASEDDGNSSKENMIEVLRGFALSITDEDKECKELKNVLERQKSFRKIFGKMFSANRVNRQYGSYLRNILCEGGLDYEILKNAYTTSGTSGLVEHIEKLKMKKREEFNDLREILDSHFDQQRIPTFPNTSKFTNLHSKKPLNKRPKSKQPQMSAGIDLPSTSGVVPESCPTPAVSNSLGEAIEILSDILRRVWEKSD